MNKEIPMEPCKHCGYCIGQLSESNMHVKMSCAACGKYIKFIKQPRENKMRLGISIRIDVTKIDKSRIFQGQKGKYLDLTTFIDTDNPGEYGDHGFISQSVSKEEREQGIRTAILGNCKVFYGLGSQQPQQPQQPQPGEDIPF